MRSETGSLSLLVQPVDKVSLAQPCPYVRLVQPNRE